MLEQALSYAQLGWHVFPLVPNKKIPLTKNGHKDATIEPQKIVEWWTKTPTANIGIATGITSNLCVLDVDIKNGARGMESLKTLSGLIPTAIVKTPSGGYHYYYYIDMPCKSVIGFRPGLDFKADGGYIVAHGSIIDGKKYDWIDAEFAPITITQVLLDEIFSKDKNSRIIAALKPQWTESKRNAINLALCGILVKSNWEYQSIENLLTLLYDKFQDPEKINRLKNLEQTYKKFKDGEKIEGYKGLEKLLPQDCLKTLITLIETKKDDPIEPGWHVPATDFLAKEPSPTKWLIESLWTDESVGFIGGEPKTGKTWLALEMAIGIATNSAVLDNFNVGKEGNVLYIAEEGRTEDMRRRLHQLLIAKEINPSVMTKLHLSILKRVQIDQEQWQKELFGFCEKFSPVAIFIDPLVRVHSLNEDNAREIQPVLRFVRSLQNIYHTSVVLIHHFKKPQMLDKSRAGQKLRGSGDLYAWLDSAIYLDKSKGESTIGVEIEHRDAPDIEPFIFSTEQNKEKNSVKLVYQQGTLSDLKILDVSAKIENFLKDNPTGLLQKEIASKIKGRSQVIFQALQKLEELGKIKKDIVDRPDKKGRIRGQSLWTLT